MRVAISVATEGRVLRAIDKATSRGRSRSRFIEGAAREFLARTLKGLLHRAGHTPVSIEEMNAAIARQGRQARGEASMKLALCNPLGRRGDEADLDSWASQHVDESIGAEQLDAAAEQVADSWLADSEELGGLRLPQAARPKLLIEPDHEVGAHQEVLRLVRRESEIPEYVSAGATHSSLGATPARASSFSTVFQLRPVPRVPSFLSMRAFVRRERPMPSG